MNRKTHPGRNNKGITLVEILITTFVMSIGILSTFLYFTTAMHSTELARDMTVATSHGTYILEDLRSQVTRETLLNAVENRDWQEWGDNLFAASTGLPSETYMVTPPADNTSDPIDIQATISWIRKSRSNSITLVTELTK